MNDGEPMRQSDSHPQAGDTSSSDRSRPAVQRLLDRPLTPELIAAATESVAKSSAQREADAVRVLVFQLTHERLALPADRVSRVAPCVVTRRIPHRSNATIRGICHQAGDLMLVADLAHLLDLPDTSQETSDASKRRMIIIGTTQQPWTFEVDLVEGVQVVSPNDLRVAPMTVTQSHLRFTSQLIHFDDEPPIALLDADQILAGLEGALT